MNSSTERSAESDKRTGFEQDLDHLRKVVLFQGLEYECLKLIAMLCKQIEMIEWIDQKGQGHYKKSCH